MKKITSRKEANEIYSLVRNSINKYITDFKVEASEIREYIINNMDRFINKYKLSEIDNVKQIIVDVVEHKNNISKDKKKKKLIKEMKSDKIIKFSNFKKINESFIEVGKSNIEHEKVLADHFNTSLGHIEEVDMENHIYSVVDFGKTQMVVIFSKEEVEKVREKIVNDLVIEISDKNLIVEEVDGLKFDSEFSLQIGSIMDKAKMESFCNNQIDEKRVLSLIGTHLSQEIVFMYNFKRVEYVTKYKDHHIWRFM